ncbi:hypothetical protein [Oerskovia flava]|uniref:hypothetical protein n=1 Tax=Oerskovia flava TaxID=2986422 RepID=UPI00223E9CB0|nr:hypothetical protein [Oerskovia sp. JB1-3-2]
MLRLPVDLLLPRTTIEIVGRRAGDRPRAPEVRIRVRGTELLARRWVQGHFATGHSVLRARLEEVPDGVRVRGAVAPSGLDLTLVGTWFVAALGIGAMGVAHANGVALLVALLPLAFGIFFAAGLPRDLRSGREVLERTLRADL